MSLSIVPIKALKDNYIWAIVNADNATAWVVDPGEANPVFTFCDDNNLRLCGILITHHHHDHCAGVKLLQQHYDIPVYGPQHAAILATQIVQGGDTIFLPECQLYFDIIPIPGHTLEHVAFSCISEQFVFCGDTLFSAGCGKIFEGTAAQMYASLMKLTDLSNDTKIYCGHEYTLANLKFAKLVEPNNRDIDNYILRAQSCYAENKPSLPSSLALEKKVNPFLRTAVPEVIQSTANKIGQAVNHPVKVFSILREWKNTH